jgi:hypothetical protein
VEAGEGIAGPLAKPKAGLGPIPGDSNRRPANSVDDSAPCRTTKSVCVSGPHGRPTNSVDDSAPCRSAESVCVSASHGRPANSVCVRHPDRRTTSTRRDGSDSGGHFASSSDGGIGWNARCESARSHPGPHHR